MVEVKNKRTGLPYNFTDDQWRDCLSKGIAGKFKVLSGGEGITADSIGERAKGTLHFTPPELEETKPKKRSGKADKDKGVK